MSSNPRETKEEVLTSWLELGALCQQNGRQPKSSEASLPRLPMLMTDIKNQLRAGQRLGLLLVRVREKGQSSDIFHWKMSERLIEFARTELTKVKSRRLRQGDFLAEMAQGSNEYVIILSSPRKKQELKQGDLDCVEERIRQFLSRAFRSVSVSPTGRELDFSIGQSLLKRRRGLPFESSISHALADATDECLRQQLAEERKRATLAKSSLLRCGLTAAFQPVIDLRSLRTVGYKASITHPQGDFYNAGFEHTQDSDFLLELQRTYLKAVLNNVPPLNQRLLFVEVAPSLLDETAFQQISRSALQCSAKQIIFVTNEDAAADDPEFFSLLAAYFKSLGCGIALSGGRSGFSLLKLIEEGSVDHIVIDPRLTTNIDRDEDKQEIVRSISKAASRSTVFTIAEDIKKESELVCLQKLGISWGSGSLISRTHPCLHISAPLGARS